MVLRSVRDLNPLVVLLSLRGIRLLEQDLKHRFRHRHLAVVLRSVREQNPLVVLLRLR